MRAWTYVIKSDFGGAPNFAPPATTLVLCKPMIRRGARPEDIVLAFNGSTVEDNEGVAKFPDPNTVRWAGVVHEVMTLAAYWDDDRFVNKKPGSLGMPDNIYRPFEDGFEQVENESHGQENHVRDIGGRNALIFQQSWYFGRGAPSLPEEFGLWMGGRKGGGRQGHRVREYDDRAAELIRWLDQAGKASPVIPKPGQSPGRCGSCGGSQMKGDKKPRSIC